MLNNYLFIHIEVWCQRTTGHKKGGDFDHRPFNNPYQKYRFIFSSCYLLVWHP